MRFCPIVVFVSPFYDLYFITYIFLSVYSTVSTENARIRSMTSDKNEGYLCWLLVHDAPPSATHTTQKSDVAFAVRNLGRIISTMSLPLTTWN